MKKWLFFVTHILSFAKFWYTNRRANKTQLRRFRVTLYEEIPSDAGGGFQELTVIKLWAKDEAEMYLFLQTDHRDIFQKSDHMTWREII